MKSMNFSLDDNASIRLSLQANQVASTREAGGLAIEVVSGSAWITFEGRGEDYVLKPGERLPVNGRGRIVVQGLEPTEVLFVPQPLPAARRLAHATAECWHTWVSSLSARRVNIDNPI